MDELFCHIAALGKNTDWIKEGLLYYDWNYLIILTTPNKDYLDLANSLKNELSLGFHLSEKRKLDLKIIKNIEILRIETRNVLDFIEKIKKKLREIKKEGYKVYFNATSGLQIWKFASYFIAATDNLIDKFYYIPTDTGVDFPIKPLEIYLPTPLSEPLKKLLLILNTKEISQKSLVEQTKFSKGLISRYLNNLREIGLIEISHKKKGEERFFKITEKGEWYL